MPAATSQDEGVSLKEHILALREADARYADVVDRNHREIATLRQTRDDLARELALTAQRLRDEHSNNLLGQLNTAQKASDERLDKANEEFATKESVSVLASEIKLLRESRDTTVGMRLGAVDLKTILMMIAAAVIGYFASLLRG